MVVKNLSKDSVLADQCSMADRFFTRFKGLMGVSHFPDGHGLLIKPCNSIHMFFMKIPLDIVFINKELQVVHTIDSLLPWRMSPFVPGAFCVIELPAGTILKSGTTTGDYLSIL